MKRIGLFGGTFDPIHFGHLKPVEEVKSVYNLDLVYFIPSAAPPHKPLEMLEDPLDRLEMTKTAVKDYRGFEASDIEFKRSGLSYSIDTVLHFKRILPPNTLLYFILGLDAFMEIDSWKSYKELFATIS